MIEQPDMLSVDDIAGLVGLSSYTVRSAIRDGELRAAKLRGRWRIHRDDLAAWIDAGQREGAEHRLELAPPSVTTTPPRRTPPQGGARAALRARRRAA